jgi:regulator of sirC expression with transglutaminase-like and TPR domain
VFKLKKLLAGEESVLLDVAALELASVEYPGLNTGPFLDLLDSYARELGERLDEDSSGQEFVEAARLYLFEELGFQGNQQDYYHPSNSCLNDVLTDRTGLPITLAVVFMEVARRLGRKVNGIGLPGHFLVQYEDTDYSAYLDPFHGGRFLSLQQCRELALEAARVDIFQAPQYLTPVSRRHIVVRMLNNLRNAYARRQEARKSIEVLNLLLEAEPGASQLHQERERWRHYLRTLN